jgi:hypothetical protein
MISMIDPATLSLETQNATLIVAIGFAARFNQKADLRFPFLRWRHILAPPSFSFLNGNPASGIQVPTGLARTSKGGILEG